MHLKTVLRRLSGVGSTTQVNRKLTLTTVREPTDSTALAMLDGFLLTLPLTHDPANQTTFSADGSAAGK